jgi:hypothetical protein
LKPAPTVRLRCRRERDCLSIAYLNVGAGFKPARRNAY